MHKHIDIHIIEQQQAGMLIHNILIGNKIDEK